MKGPVDLWKVVHLAVGTGFGLRTFMCTARAGSARYVEGRFSAAHARGIRERPLWKKLEAHRNACTKLWISLSNSGFCLRSSSILGVAGTTVGGCLPPNSLPIS